MTTEKAKTDLKEVKREHENLRKKYEATKKELKEAQKENERYKQLNFDLQTEVIEVFKEQNVDYYSVIEKQLKGSTSKATDAYTINADHNFAPVGYHKKSDDTYHIGHNVWLKSVQFNNIMYNSKSPRKCVGNTLISLFDLRTLLVSTATGKLSNNTLGKLKKGGANVDTKCQKLDPSKLAAVKTLYNYWLEQEYIKHPNVTEAMCFQEIASFHDHVSAEIAYLKRGTKPTKGARASKGKKRSALTDDTVAPKKKRQKDENGDALDLERSDDQSNDQNTQVEPTEDEKNNTNDDENLNNKYNDENDETLKGQEYDSGSSTCSIRTSDLVSSEEEE
ncbi:hypothetical protein TSAR_012704 [Trichomalopsis sarcophagae]|uniref:BEN domain-containing protein n=1 Tax=Trichomalopsis sarcophagae TaxID=543379 RepID=A0A232EET8_9HYME|nr:hypothetical protein TSAR_012704 [Trichomalopsis sarcophagae]